MTATGIAWVKIRKSLRTVLSQLPDGGGNIKRRELVKEGFIVSAYI
jgi:hypothetical protein